MKEGEVRAKTQVEEGKGTHLSPNKGKKIPAEEMVRRKNPRAACLVHLRNSKRGQIE